MSASRVFEAQFFGDCARCDDGITKGDLVRYVDDQLVHFIHVGAKDLRPEVICDKCWLVKPNAGPCPNC